MKKALMLCVVFFCCSLVTAAQKNESVLIILTSGKQLVVNGNPLVLGYWGEELASPLAILERAGIKVELASPDGTTVLDPNSLNAQFTTPAVADLVKATDARLKQSGVRKLHDINGAKYDAILIVGGHGAMFDVNKNPDTIRIINQAYKKGKIVAAQCHGTGALAFAGLIKGMWVTGFPKAWEPADLKPLLPYVLEDELNKASGGNYQSGLREGQPPQPLVIISGKVITSRDPMSSEAMGRALLKALKSGLKGS